MRRWRPLFGWALVVVLVCGLALLSPFLGTLDYEYCLICTLLLSLALTDLSAWVFSRDDAARSDKSDIAVLGAVFTLFAAVPWLMAAVVEGYRGPCNMVTGTQMYLLLPGVGCVAGVLTGWGASLLRTWNVRRVRLWAFLFVAGVTVGRLTDLYFTPTVQLYGTYFGYFSGAIYDEHISVTPALILARIEHIICLFSVVVTVYWVRRRSLGSSDATSLRVALSVVGVVAAAALMGVERGRMSWPFNTTAGGIAEILGGHLRSRHFDIVYDLSLSTEGIKRLIQEHEFHYNDVSERYGLAARELPIRSYVFRDRRQKRRLMGAAGTSIAKPWRGEIYLQYAESMHPVLRHELVHVLAAEWGDPVLGISLGNLAGLPWPVFSLIEGLAVAIDWPIDQRWTVHQKAAVLLADRELPALDQLSGLGFYRVAASRAYVVTGSFLRFVLDNEGVETVRELYASGDLAGERRLEVRWKRFLRREVEVPADLQSLARARFMRPSIVKRSCPHEAARLLADSAEQVSLGRLEEAYALGTKATDRSPMDIRAQLWALELGAEIEAPEHFSASARKLIGRKDLPDALRARVLLMVADRWWREGAIDKAQRVLRESAAMDLSPEDRRAFAIRERVLADFDQYERALAQRYFECQRRSRWSANDDANLCPSAGYALGLLAHTQPRWSRYWAMELLVGRDDEVAGREAFTVAQEPPLEVLEETSLQLAQVATFRAGDYAAARQWAKKLRRLRVAQGSARALVSSRWIDYLSFLEAAELVSRNVNVIGPGSSTGSRLVSDSRP